MERNVVPDLCLPVLTEQFKRKRHPEEALRRTLC
jgi:hypothetical protein